MSVGVIRSSVSSSVALSSMSERRACPGAGRELGLDGLQFLANDGGDALRTGQDVEQVGDGGHDVLVFANDLVLLQAGQALQAHVQDFLRLRIAQAIHSIALQAKLRAQVVGTESLAAARRVAIGARDSISRTSDESHERAISSWRATGGVGAA